MKKYFLNCVTSFEKTFLRTLKRLIRKNNPSLTVNVSSKNRPTFPSRVRAVRKRGCKAPGGVEVEKFMVSLVSLLVLVALTGLLLFLLWPVVIPAVFPGFVASGAISANINFWTCLGISFICGLLFRGAK